jgi:hypothetical protein
LKHFAGYFTGSCRRIQQLYVAEPAISCLQGDCHDMKCMEDGCATFAMEKVNEVHSTHCAKKNAIVMLKVYTAAPPAAMLLTGSTALSPPPPPRRSAASSPVASSSVSPSPAQPAVRGGVAASRATPPLSLESRPHTERAPPLREGGCRGGGGERGRRRGKEGRCGAGKPASG